MTEWFVIGIPALNLIYGIVTYNRLVRDRQLTRTGWSDIGVQLKPRHDLIPMLLFFWACFSFGFPLIEFAEDVPIPLVGGLVAMLAMHYFLYQWLKAPTLAGGRLLDQFEGFKHYLQVVEDDEIAMRNAPDFSIDIYETWLPYAIALGLENEWTAKLNRALAAGTVDGSYAGPAWYHAQGHSGSHFSSPLAGSLDSAIASSSVAPGSSSGSSGESSGGGW